MLDDGLAGTVINEGEDGEDDCKLWDADAGGAKGVNNGPGMAKPGDFGKDEATS